jgi:thymidylate synthase ThyX
MPEEFSPKEKSILARYVSNVERPVFVLKDLPEEVVAVLFAYYSRSSQSLRKNLLKLIQEGDLDLGAAPEMPDLSAAKEKARQFHEKWVVGYGHASVAEHAIAHIAVEDASILVSKVIEDARLASYTEKSTRYVVFDPERYYRAPELEGTGLDEIYHETIRHLMRLYSALWPEVIEKLKREMPRREGQTEAGYASALRAKACDLLRYILPTATLTNIGITINARALEHMITKLLSHPLLEARQFGAAIKEEALSLIPTLIKYADRSTYILETESEMWRLASELVPAAQPKPEPNCARLISYREDAEDHLVAAVLYGFVQIGAEELVEKVKQMTRRNKELVIDEYLKRRGKWDAPLRALEHIYYTFEIIVDYGAFRDIQRHRMATQTNQLLSDELGWETPPELIEYGHGAAFDEAMELAGRAYRKISRQFPYEAQYVLPLAYRKRALFTWNLRELHHFIQLRSSRQGHPSYRAIARQVYRELERVHPLLARYIRVDLQDYALSRA